MLSNEDSLNAFLQKARSDSHLRFSISRNTIFAIIFSLIIHGLLLLLVTPLIDLNKEAILPARELTVSMAPPTPEKKINTETEIKIAPETEAKPIPPKPAKTIPKAVTPFKPKVKPPVKKAQQAPKKTQEPPFVKTPDVITAEVPETLEAVPEKTQPNLNIPKESFPRQSLPEEAYPKESPKTDAPVDMMAYVNQKRAAREAFDSNAAKINAEATAKELGPSAEQIRDEKIKRNFENGTNGIFEITSLGARNAAFAFRGWTSDFGNSRREFFVVEAKSGQDVRLIMIKKMISLIRQHYKGDFNWESHRLGRTIIMSARIEDSEGLEDFMMKEFFGSNYKTSQLY